jgi:2-C-methyl-D-erythritol 4-phosphate cytidylyltransferase
MHAIKASIAAIICAAGSSKRMGGVKKEFLGLPSSTEKPLTVLGGAVSVFASCPQIGPIVITVAPGEENTARRCLPEEILPEKDRIFFVEGGPTRRASVYNALLFLESLSPSHVLIHDGARPWVKRELIERLIEAVIRHGAAIPALPIIETPKELDRFITAPETSGREPGFIKRHLRRESVCTAQTPQCFRFPEILAAHEKAREREEAEGFEYTDDAEVWGGFTGRVAVISGDPENRKITYPGDINQCSE